ncbi:MAG: NHL repeat-containing protein, partial [Bryobacteraceae bacterium]
MKSGSPNLVEGRELSSPFSVAVDAASGGLYVADTGNNRVLAWRNAAGFANGAPADVVIGQVDKVSTSPLGPGSSRSTGLSAPTAVVVDRDGNLYVADSGNNRILRFPAPFTTPGDVKTPDLVIGQRSFDANRSNEGGVSERSLSLSTNTLATSGLAFDPQGNLWVADALNHRVLRYPASSLNAGNHGPAADLVLGQTAFNLNANPSGSASNLRANKGVLRTPSALAIDSAGNIYVADALQRVLFYASPLTTGKAANRLLGVPPPVQQGQPVAPEYVIGQAEGLAMLDGDRLAVADSAIHRILIYDNQANWPLETTSISPPAVAVLGQQSFAGDRANRDRPEPADDSLASPFGLAFAGGTLYVADRGNHRVLAFPQPATGSKATRVLGQDGFNSGAVNLIEGRELFLHISQQNAATSGGGVALDTRTDAPHLYIADTFNNRILGFRDARQVRPGGKADLVIG